MQVRRPVSRVLSPPVRAMDGHSSGMPVTGHLARPTRVAARKHRCRLPGVPPLFGLAPGGVYLASAVTGAAVRSYRTLSPLPPSSPSGDSRGWRFAFCGTFPEVTLAGRYPAPYFRGARTFLPSPAASAPGEKRSSGRLARPYKMLAREIVKSKEATRRFWRAGRCAAPSRRRARRCNSLDASGAGRR